LGQICLNLSSTSLLKKPRSNVVRLGLYCLFSTVIFLGLGEVSPAAAFDFFGFFGSDDTPAPVSAETLPYELKFQVDGLEKGDDSDVVQVLRDASVTYRLRQDAPLDGDALLRRLQADNTPIRDALWSLGYYDAHLDVLLADQAVDFGDQGFARSVAAADGFRNRAAVPIKMVATLGPLFRLRALHVDVPHDDAPDGLPRLAFRLKAGDPARSADIRAAQVRLVDWFRARGHPLAKIADVKAVVDHAAHVMDLDLKVDPGPAAGIGPVVVSGTSQEAVRAAIVSHIYLQHGEPYSPDRLAETKKSIARIQAIGGIRIREGDRLDADGNLPIFVDVTERPDHLAGASARYSTKDGPGLTTYWEDRNLFGGGERLRLEGDLSLLQRVDGTSYHGLSGIKLSDVGARFGASFIKPGLFGSPNDLLIDTSANRERVGNNTFGGYTAHAFGGTIGVIHRFSDTISMQAGLQVKQSTSVDVLGRVDATLVGVTAAAHYDTTDNLLDPTRGIRAQGSVQAFPRALGSTIDLVESRISGSTYYALDEDANYVLAGRIAAGTLAGAALAAIPSEERFYSGGGGSVRGFTFGTISPLLFNQITGGRSLLEGSAEVRVKLTQTIGIVPFIDAGGVFRSSLPNFQDYVGIGAGLGLRYLTPIGPIRLDVATPVNRRPGDSPVAIYVSIGQAF
jgi:translocation and assembly module TamA